jgi:hypothetical protein
MIDAETQREHHAKARLRRAFPDLSDERFEAALHHARHCPDMVAWVREMRAQGVPVPWEMTVLGIGMAADT